MDKIIIFEQLLHEANELVYRKENIAQIMSKCDYHIKSCFGSESIYLMRLKGISFRPRGIRVNNQPVGSNSFQRGKRELIGLLQEIIDTLGMDKKNIESSLDFSNKDIFIVHGHDEEMKLNVARFIETLDLTPIILNEKANCGDTIIEKLERYSKVGFAIVLLSPCDDGRKHGSKKWNPRARQNVIAEMGYFIGKIGRNRVCILRKLEVEEPSDFTGIVYTPYDENNGWKIKLCQELNAAGYNVDANKIIG